MKRTIWFMLLAMLAASLLPFCAHAQVGPPGVVGTITAGHCVSWHDPGNIQDAGANCGGTGAPGGSNFSVQYNNTGSFGGLLPGGAGTYCIQWSSLVSAPVLTTSCGSVTIPGANTQVIFNNSGAFGASSNFTWTSASNILNLGAGTVPGTYSVGVPDSMTISGVALAVPGFSINSNIQGNIEAHSFSSTSANGSTIYGARARGTFSTPTAVVNGDNLLTLAGAGFDGTNYDWGAHIHFQVDGTPGLNVLPGAIDFQTTPAGSNTPVSVFLLHANGSYGVNGSTGAAGQALISNGSGAAAAFSSSLSGVGSVNGSTIPASAGTLSGSTGAFTLNDCLKVGSTSPLEIADAGAACGSGGGGGISQLTGDVTAGPGTGSVPATVVKVNGAAVPTSASVIASNGSNQLTAATGPGILAVINSSSCNAQVGTTYTYVIGDANNCVTGSNAAAQTYTIPPNSGVAFNIGTTLTQVQLGSGIITVAPGTGVTLQSAKFGSSTSQTYAMAGAFACLSFQKTATDTWFVAECDYNPAGGTVTSVAVTVPTGFTVSGSPVTSTGTISISHSGDVVGGTKFTITPTGCTPSATTGGATAGTITLAAGPCTSIIITMNGATGLTASNGWHCNVGDRTLQNAGTWFGEWPESSSTTTTATITVPAAAGATDVLTFNCTGF